MVLWSATSANQWCSSENACGAFARITKTIAIRQTTDDLLTLDSRRTANAASDIIHQAVESEIGFLSVNRDQAKMLLESVESGRRVAALLTERER